MVRYNRNNRTIITYIFSSILLSLALIQTGCVQHNMLPDAGGEIENNSLPAPANLQQLKSRIVACGTQYMVSQQQNTLSFGYQIAEHRIQYQTADNTLSNYLNVCVGETTTLSQADHGTIEIAGQ